MELLLATSFTFLAEHRRKGSTARKYTKLASLDHNLQEEGCPHSILKEKSLKVNEARPYSCEEVMAKKKHKSDTWTEEDELLNK